MTTYKPIFFRPIEIVNSGTKYNRITYTYTGHAAVNADIDLGVYSSLPALLEAIETAGLAIAPGGHTCAWSLVESGFTVYVRCVTDVSCEIDFPASSELKYILGDPAESFNAAGTTHTAPYPPWYTWVPTYQNATQDHWQQQFDKQFAGRVTQTGELAGNRIGPAIWFKKLRFFSEPALNIYDDASTDTYIQECNLESFLDCMYSTPEDDANPSTRGFFYYPDWNNAINYPEDVPGGTTGIATTYHGTQYDLSSSPDRFTFCQFAENPLNKLGAAFDKGRNYQEVEFEIHTVESMPTWAAPDQSG